MTVFWNSMKTTLFLGALTGMFLLTGAALGGTRGMILAGLFAVAINMAAWWWSDKLALRFSGARAVSEDEAPDLHRMVDVLARRAGIPKPAVYLVDNEAPNAFATGRSPARGAVAVTTGLQALLTREELAGVVAHELAHIKNRDTLISSIAATIGGAVSMIADLALWSMIFGGDEEEGGGGIVAIIVAPIAALLVQMAISRSREFVADATGAQILGTAEPLATALEKLEAGVARRPMEVNPATSHLYIVNPIVGGGLAGLFRTHPQTEKRVAALRSLKLTQEPHTTPAFA
jgi:heat shock protein HtpX